MPANEIEIAYLGQPPPNDLDLDHERLEHVPQDDNKIGKWTIVALILNRTIGSGIFLTPDRILAGTGCVGGALLLWVLGAVISVCGLYVWLECGESMPQRQIDGEPAPRGVPRSGGEKNFLEFMFPDRKKSPTHLRTTCSFAIMFILMYNLSGNAMSLALQVEIASGMYDPGSDVVPARSTTVGIAIAFLSLVVVAHILSRGAGIRINNAFAIIKVALLLTIVSLGIAKAAGRFGGSGDIIRNNFTKDVWTTQRTDAVSWSNSLLLAMYCFSGFEQPFYVLAETKSPRKIFPRYTVLALAIATILFILVNISYLLVVDKDVVMGNGVDPPPNIALATLFFDRLFEDDRQSAGRAMAALISLSIFGNLWVMTFTAARVKQEIAKEGILPYSLYIATSYTTPYGLWQKWSRRSKTIPGEQFEQAPTAAFALHWFTSVLLIAVTAAIFDPRKTYSALVSLYSYTIILVLGCWVSRQSPWHFRDRRRYRPWLSPIHAIVYAIATAWLLVTAFLPPQLGSPYHEDVTGLPWYIVPTIGITAPLWGLLWYCGILIRERLIGRHLVVSRAAFWEPDPDDPGEYVEFAEIIHHAWQITARDDMSENFRLEPRDDDGGGPEDNEAGGLDARPNVQRGAFRRERRLSDGFGT
ncbi:hypothetical protein LTR56_005513 [Elasticomyces elasticus]|nr:hypothetical protein LTR22_017899 [Elasticomyces elasticus]KAK3651705.1 hypothetical protein LTR56_005513 [Elasticomyces elasticus]KAK4912879.1 hypothetical protein LTR49_018735 [Elasticomyces elasticus]KAK5769196.1 hypothetical protein LTS12_000547 [Elasticomyces elasticus]